MRPFGLIKIPKRYYPLLIVLLISAVIIAWGGMNLNLNNTATVTLAAKNLAVDIIPSDSTCPAYGAGVYGLTNTTIALTWPVISEPGSVSRLFCLENVGTATQGTITLGTVSPSPSPGTLTIAPVGSQPITATGITSLTETLTATVGTPATTYSFSLVIS
jgi:hypothetical protein